MRNWQPDLLLQRSYWFLVFCSFFHLLAALWVSVWSVSIAIKVLLIVLVVANAIYYGLHDVKMSLPSSVLRIFLNDEGWYLQSNGGLVGPYRLSPRSWLLSGVILLAFEPASNGFGLLQRWRGRYQLILKDSLCDDDFRRLQVFLRWQSASLNHPAAGSRE